MLSASMYLPVRHDQVAKELYRKLMTPDENAKVPILDSYSTDNIDIWWDTKIKTPCGVKHNKPDIIIWRKNEKKCDVIDIVVGLDVNVADNCTLKTTTISNSVQNLNVFMLTTRSKLYRYQLELQV